MTARGGGLALFALVAGLALLFSWSRVHFNLVFLAGALENVAGIDPRGAAKPFQYRVLVPGLVRFLHEHVVGWATPRQIFIALDALCVIGTFYVLRRLARDLFGSERLALLTACGLFHVLPFHFLFSREYPFWYAWDISSMLVFTCGLVLLRRRQWGLYYALFVIGTFNRETTIFLTLAQLFTQWNQGDRLRLAGHCAVQVLTWLAIKCILWMIYRDQPGADSIPLTYQENWQALQDPAMYRWFAMIFGGLWIVLLLGYRRIGDPWIRHVLLVFLPFAAGNFFAGVWTELRTWAEMIPIALLGAVAAMTAVPRQVGPTSAFAGARDPATL
jgi:hypothetical protein